MMNDQLNPKERELKELLQNASFELDTNAIWNSIEHRVPTKKDKNRVAIWWWSIGVFLIVGLVSVGWFLGNDEQHAGSNAAQVETNNSINEIHASNINKNEELNSPAEYLKNDLSSDLKLINQDSEIKIIEQTLESNLRNAQGLNYETLSEDRTPSQNINNVVFSRVVAKSLMPRESINDDRQSNKSNIVLEESKIVSEVLEPVFINLLSSSAAELSYKRNQLILSTDLAPLSLIEPVQEKNYMSFVSFGIGTNKNISTYKAINSTGEFRPEILQKEAGQWGLSADLLYNIQNKSAWTLGLGISYDMNVSRYLDLGENIIQTNSIGDVEIDIDSDGTITPLTGELTQTTVDNANIQWYRQHHNVDAQIRIGKKLWNANRWSVDVDGGVLYNIYSRSSGYYFEDTAEGLVKFKSSENHPYKKRQGFKTQVGFQLTYALSNVDLGFRTSYRYNPSSILEKNHFYELKNSQLGIQISVAYRPNWE